MKKHHWHAFQYEKLFKKQPLPHCQAFVLLVNINTTIYMFGSQNTIKTGDLIIKYI
jgi:hypothetical protein